METPTTGRRRSISGPEPWRGDWTYWDLWYSVVCVVDCNGDFDVLDQLIIDKHRISRDQAEAKWSHLRDLRRRLLQANLTPTDLAGDLASDKTVRRRAREKVLKSYLYEEHKTPAMRDVPSKIVTGRAKRGRWPNFPVSPQDAYDRLAGTVRFRGGYRSEYKTARTADAIEAAVPKLLARLGRNEAARLAIRRASLTLVWDVHDVGNDSLGQLGMVAQDLLDAYTETPWRDTGISAKTYWSDLLEFMSVEDYGMTFKREVSVLRAADVARDLDGALGILGQLYASYVDDRLAYDAEQALGLMAYALVAAGAVERFPEAAARLGSSSWVALDAMVQSATRNRRRDIAIAVLDAADVPGLHQEWVRERRAAL